MHVLVAFACDLSEACRHVLSDLALPHLERLLAAMPEAGRDAASEASLSPPHERALAAARGWHGADGSLPFAARAAAGDGLAPGRTAWGLMTPSHWQLGHAQAVLLDPAELALEAAESAALFADVQPLATSERFACEWGAAGRWYLGRDDLEGLPCASVDRVVGRDIGSWLPGVGGLPEAAASEPAAAAAARRETWTLLRRLQSEAQLVLHAHPVNEAREERGALPVNSFWLSGCGRAQAGDDGAEPLRVDALRGPLLASDWAAWADAWRAVDAGPLAALQERLKQGEPASLTLCGERSAARFEPAPRGWRSAWRTLRRHASARDVLATL